MDLLGLNPRYVLDLMHLLDLLDTLDLDYLGTWISTCRLVLDLDPDGDLDVDPYLAITLQVISLHFATFAL